MEASSESIAGDGVADRQREEGEPDGQHDEVKHLELPAARGAPNSVIRPPAGTAL
jgi:hypothetical protein